MSLRDSLSINGRALSETAFVAEDFREWQPLEIECVPQPAVVAAHLAIGDLDLGPPTTLLGDTRWRWRWNPQHAVGHYLASLQLRYADGQTETERFTLRILPRNIDAERYHALLLAIQQDARALVHSLSGGRSAATLQTSAQPPTLVEEYYLLVERHTTQALAVVKALGRAAQSRLVPRSVDVSLWELDRIDPGTVADMAQSPMDDVVDDVLPALQGLLRSPSRTRGGPLPRWSSTKRSEGTHDIVEHRVLKYVLQSLLWRVTYVSSLARREQLRRQKNASLVDSPATAAVDKWLLRCDEATSQLRSAMGLPWLVDVGALGALAGPTELMRREPRYRRLYQLYRDMRTAPFIAFDSPHLWMPIHELPLLYEQWCALRVVKALLPLGIVVAQNLVEPAEGGERVDERRWTLRLQQARPLLVLGLPEDRTLTVWYQRRYQPADSSTTAVGTLDPFVRIPDIAVELSRAGDPPEVIVVDAKYRVAADDGIPQDALDDAYAYRSAIGVAGKRATLGALLLFPGSRRLMTVDRVGALPLLPGESDELGHVLRSFLGCTPMASHG